MRDLDMQYPRVRHIHVNKNKHTYLLIVYPLYSHAINMMSPMPQNTKAICFPPENAVWNFCYKYRHVSTVRIASLPPEFEGETRIQHQ
jgi:hypothetical protein